MTDTHVAKGVTATGALMNTAARLPGPPPVVTERPVVLRVPPRRVFLRPKDRLHALAATAALAASMAGCIDMATASSGQVGCSPSDVKISEEETGWGSKSWVATCHGRRFHCSQVATGKNNSQVSCSEETQAEPPAQTSAPEVASARKTIDASPASFTLPRNWVASAGAVGEVWRSADGARTAFLRRNEYAGTCEEFLGSRHSEAEVGPAKVGGVEAAIGRWTDGDRHVTAVAVVRDGVGYELVCTDYGAIETSGTCKTILGSLRVK